MSKFSIKTESKHVESIPLNQIKSIGVFQSLNKEEEKRLSRLDEIDSYYGDIQEIINSKVKSGVPNKKYGVKKIEEIYFKIFQTKGKDKNYNIDAIVDFYKNKYAARTNNNKINNLVNMTQNDFIKQQPEVPNFSDYHQAINDSDSSDEEAEF